MGSPLKRFLTVARAGVLAFLILAFGQGVWGALLASNFKTGARIPWGPLAMALVLWLMWQYLGGKWWPHSTAEARRRYLRARVVPGPVFAWVLLAGILSIVALAGYWIVMFQLVKMPGNVIPSLAGSPFLTVALVVIMASLVAPFTEEPAFRGYCQVSLERDFSHYTRIPVAETPCVFSRGPCVRCHCVPDQFHSSWHSGSHHGRHVLLHSDLAARHGTAAGLGRRCRHMVLGSCCASGHIHIARHPGLQAASEDD